MLKNEIIKKVEQEFQEKQNNIRNSERKQYFSNMLNPNFAILEKEIRELNLKIARLEENDNTAKALQKELDEKIIKQNQLRTNSPISFECELCKDSGVVGNEYCCCFKKRVNQLLIKESGIQTENLKHFADSDFSKFEHPDEIKKVYEVFNKLLNNLDSTKYKNFLIQGDSGVGKTFLLSAIAGETIDRGYTMFFITAFNLNQLMLKYHTNFENDRIKFLAPIFESEVLIIDDLGTEQILRNITKEYLLEILKTRVLEGKHTFISTNLNLDLILDKYGERIFSRMVDKSNSITLKIENQNLRLKK